MHNDFVVVGPKSDPAKVKGDKSAADAFKKIAAAKSTLITRGDDSGTHKKELKIWDEATVKPSGAWYVNTGQGMGETLRIADQKSGYTLTDRGTWLSTKSSLPNLEIVVEGDNLLQNFYHVIVVSKKKFPKINEQGAIAFSEFIISPETQKMIGEFGREKYGQPLFIPDAGKKE
jgi:tungstate transport system substrate-binding protein